MTSVVESPYAGDPGEVLSDGIHVRENRPMTMPGVWPSIFLADG